MRLELKVFRYKQKLNQKDVAERVGVSIATYNLIENGNRRGSQEFWETLQKEFNLEDGEVWRLQKNTI